MIVDHVSITVSDMARSAPFYDAIMAALGVPCVWREDEAVGYGFRNGPDDDGRSYMTVRKSTGIVKPDNRHWCFAARERSAVDAFHAAGVASGGRCGGPPGPRPDYHEAYYAAFLLDPDGNRIEAVCHRR